MGGATNPPPRSGSGSGTSKQVIIKLRFASQFSLMFPVLGLFVSSVGNISDIYRISATPAGWTFTIWAVIFSAQIAFAVYSLSTTFRR